MEPIETKVLVIGAGIAGLKAAEELQLHGVDFLVVEGRERAGGRLHSVPFLDGQKKVDLGASWFHDTLCNELFDEVVEEGKHGLYYDDGAPVLVTESGIVDGNELKLEQISDEMAKFIELELFQSLKQKDISLKAKVVEYLFKQRRLLTDEQIKWAPQLLRYLELWHGIGWQSMSSKYAMVDNVGRNCLITDGYGSVVDSILARIPAERIKYSTVVSKIDREKSNKVVVTTTSGLQYHAQYCIVTVPQSILQLDVKEHAGITWQPLLPARITEALSKMHFGSLGKFIFEFDELFWDAESTDRFVLLATPEAGVLESLRRHEKPTVSEFEPEDVEDPKPWQHPVLILNLYKSCQVPALLVFTQGQLTRNLEKTPALAWPFMKPVITQLSRNGKVPEPVNVIASSWTQDPFARGSYAACYPGDDPTDLIIQLSNGLGNVRFAGEHTILDGAGAVHGAWMSGRREAHHVLVELGLKTESQFINT